ncbi:MAG: response regulator [Myxococcota bacterium]
MSRQILIVEDDRALGGMLVRALEGEGYRARIANDGEAALEMIKASPPGLVILDLLLPKKDGRAVLERMRAKEKTQGIPVIAISGVLKGGRTARELEQAGAQMFMPKPIRRTDLLEAVERLIGRARSGKHEDGLSLSNTSVAELLGGAIERSLSGAIRFEQGRKRKAIRFVTGKPCQVRSNVVKECLGHRLLAAGRIDQKTLDASSRRTRAGKIRQGEILIELEVLTPEELKEELRQQARDKMLDLFTWSEGDIQFEADEKQPLKLATPLEDCDLEELILEGVERMQPDALARGLNRVKGKRIETDLEGRSEGVKQAPAVTELIRALESAGGHADRVVEHHGSALFTLMALGAAWAAGERRARPERPADEAAGSAPPSRRASSRSGRVTREELLELQAGGAMESHFEVLGLKAKSSPQECKSAFFKLAKRYHPDRFTGDDETLRTLASDVFARISVAHEVLTSSEQRPDYLRQLEGTSTDTEVNQILTAELQFQKGEALFRKKDYRRALEQFKWAVELNPEEGEFLALYGWTTYLVHPEDPEAREQGKEHLAKAIEFAPRSSSGYYYLGQLFKACGELKRAETMFRQVLELDPKHVEAARELRVFKMRRGGEEAERGSGLFGFGRKKG